MLVEPLGVVEVEELLVELDVVQHGLGVVDEVDPPGVVEVLVDVDVLVVSHVSEYNDHTWPDSLQIHLALPEQDGLNTPGPVFAPPPPPPPPPGAAVVAVVGVATKSAGVTSIVCAARSTTPKTTKPCAPPSAPLVSAHCPLSATQVSPTCGTPLQQSNSAGAGQSCVQIP